MPGVMKMLLAAAAIGAAGAGAARADVILYNNAPKSVWFTIYGPVGNGIGHGCLATGENITKRYSVPNDGATGGIVYVRGELKENADCGGRTLSDTGRGSPFSVPSRGLLKTFQLVGGQLRR